MESWGLQLSPCVGPFFWKEAGMPEGFSKLLMYRQSKQSVEADKVAPYVSKLASN